MPASKRLRAGAAVHAMLIAGACAAGQPPAPACTDWGRPGKLLYQDDFDAPRKDYVFEYAAGPRSTIAVRDGRLLIDVDSGATVWLDRPLRGNVLISYTRRVVVDGGRNDRLSDFNHFWMANDPRQTNLYTRSGKFEDYDDLDLYYAGIGGNGNTTTRLRRYGKGERRLLAEYTDRAHLLQANRDYVISIAVYKGCIRMRVDGEDYFTWRDPQPYTGGYFGWRATWSRQTVDDLKIYQLE